MTALLVHLLYTLARQHQAQDLKGNIYTFWGKYLVDFIEMAIDDESVEVNVEFPRKRRKNKADWKKNKAKTRRHSGEGKINVFMFLPFWFKLSFNKKYILMVLLCSQQVEIALQVNN